LHTYPLQAHGRTQLATNFYLDEWNCKDGTTVPEQYFWNTFAIATELQELRNHLNAKYSVMLGRAVTTTINSGYRSTSYNKSVGGVRERRSFTGRLKRIGSRHLYGQAADISVDGLDTSVVYLEVKALQATGHLKHIGGIGVYDTFIHLDARTVPAFWDERTR